MPNDDELMLDVGQANELKLAFRRAGYTNAEIKKLCEGNLLAQLLPVIKGNAKVIVLKHVIDCDADPFLPNYWKVKEHRKGGQLEWDTSKILLFLVDEQKEGKCIEGNKLYYKELKGKLVLNACVLDYLLFYPDLIPEEWKGKNIFFWGTIYRHADGDLYVRYLYWNGDRWNCYDSCLGGAWDTLAPAALLASQPLPLGLWASDSDPFGLVQ